MQHCCLIIHWNKERRKQMNKATYYIGLVLAICTIIGGIIGGIIGLVMGMGGMGFALAVLGYILMVLLDFADAYIGAHSK